MPGLFATENLRLVFVFVFLNLLSLASTTRSFSHSKTAAVSPRRISVGTISTRTQLGFAHRSIDTNHSHANGIINGRSSIVSLGYSSNANNRCGNGKITRSLHVLGSSKPGSYHGKSKSSRTQLGSSLPKNVLRGSSSLFRVASKRLISVIPNVRNKNNRHGSNDADDPLNRVRVFRQLPLRSAFLAFSIYLSVGVLAYKVVFPEVTWSVLDALYFSSVCLSTIGYGDLVPSTNGGKVFAGIFGMTGILLWSSAITSVGTKLVQKETKTANANLRTQRKNAVFEFYDQNMPDLLKFKQRKREECGEEDGQEDESCSIESEPSWPLKTPSLPKQKPKQRKKGMQWILLVRSLIRPLLVILAGGTFIGKLEGWNFCDSFYFSLVTASTIGFGDYSPTTRAGRMASIALIPIFLASAGAFFAKVGVFVIRLRTRQLFASQAERAEWLTEKQANEMDLDGNGVVSKSEYVLYMLLEAGIVSQEESSVLEEQFERFDLTKSGHIEAEDLKAMKKFREKLRRRERTKEKRTRVSQQ